jgi:hypothetical protein
MGGGMSPIPGTAYGGATDPSALQITDGFRLIPSIAVGERYDSNVLFAAKNSGFVREDYVTTAIPQLRGLYAGDLFTVNAMAAAVGEYYVKDPGLSYVGTNVGGILDMSKLASRLRERTQFSVFDTFSYTPQPPAFLTGDTSGEANNTFLRGYQVGRTNTQTNIVGTNLAVPLNQSVNLIGSYTNGYRKFGTSDVQQPGSLINTTFQTYTAGLSMIMSSQDIVSLTFVGSEYDSGAQGTFATYGGTVGWARQFTPNVGMNSAAGAQVVNTSGLTTSTSGGTTSTNGATSSTSIAPLGRFSLFWKDRTTTLTGNYSVGVTPSAQFQTQAVLSNVVSVTLTQQTAIPELLGIASLNYGRGDATGSSATSSSLSYTAWGGTGGLVYRFTPKTFLGLTYSYQNSDQSFGAQSFVINRQVVQFSLTQAFY